MDSLLARVDALEQQVHIVEQHTRAVRRQLRWWRGVACGLVVRVLLSWALPLYQAPDASAAKNPHEDAKKRHKDNDVEEPLAALEDKLAAFTFDAANNEVVITGANLRILNGLGTTDTTNGLGNLIAGYNEPRNDPSIPSDMRTGSYNVVVGMGEQFFRLRRISGRRVERA